ncbi:MAG: alpha/beta fold hydrolase [Gammaproteobacteria bacterium]|jgi:pimeloyl-ACP methyl ester carboxylesterase
MSESIRFQIAGLTFQGLCFGPADGVPVLALHGWLDNAASFVRLGPLLAGCRVVAIDQRGHGLTDHFNRPYHIWDGVPDVIGVLDALGWDQSILLGHSMGAAVATLVASAYPDRIRELWLLEGLGPWTYPDGEAPDLLRTATDRLQRVMDRQKPVYTSIDAAIEARVRGGVVPLTRQAAEPIVQRGLVKIHSGWTWSADQYLTLPPLFRLDETQIQTFIQRLETPVSLALGNRGFFKEPLFLPDRIKLCRDIRVETFEGGHHLHLEGAERAIAKWLLEEHSGV